MVLGENLFTSTRDSNPWTTSYEFEVLIHSASTTLVARKRKSTFSSCASRHVNVGATFSTRLCNAEFKDLTDRLQENGISYSRGFRIGAQLKVPLIPLDTIVAWCPRGFWGCPQLRPQDCRETPVSRTGVRLVAVVFHGLRLMTCLFLAWRFGRLRWFCFPISWRFGRMLVLFSNFLAFR